jgi:hypothetical protein
MEMKRRREERKFAAGDEGKLEGGNVESAGW